MGRMQNFMGAGRIGLFSVLTGVIGMMILLSLSSCSTPQIQKGQARGVYHVVKKGETAYSIARAYSINLQELAEINNISDVANIKEGQVIFIPDAHQVIEDVMIQAGKSGLDLKRDLSGNERASQPPPTGQGPEKSLPGEKDSSPKSIPSQPSVAEPPGGAVASKDDKPSDLENQGIVKLEKGKFSWPVQGVVKTRFGIQPTRPYHFNSWIKIVCGDGAKVKAAGTGTVIFSSALKDFGETVIIRHANDFATVYTHLKKRYVKQDRSVKKGDVIALAGEKDEMGETYIHFEVRYKGKARNPLFYLP